MVIMFSNYITTNMISRTFVKSGRDKLFQKGILIGVVGSLSGLSMKNFGRNLMGI